VRLLGRLGQTSGCWAGLGDKGFLVVLVLALSAIFLARDIGLELVFIFGDFFYFRMGVSWGEVERGLLIGC
jgi:hypothetical protein